MIKQILGTGAAVFGVAMLMSSANAQPGGRPGPGHGPGNDRIECSSRDYRYTRCDVNWDKAELVRQTSTTRCVKGQNWGIDRRGLWVDRGCAGVFAKVGHGGGMGHGAPGWNTDIRLTCGSAEFRYRMCQVDVGTAGRVRIERQMSTAACIEGRTWGFNRAGVWVDRGCSATFVVSRAGR
jgi:peptide methionine sulfoxide reductase MsrB